MVNNCANPKCAKPLHYLREGKIYVFDAENNGNGDGQVHRMEHYWLCGVCAQTMRLEKTAQGVRIALRPGFRMRETMEDIRQPIAS